MYIDQEARDKIIEITEEMQGVICKLCIRLNPHHRECPMCDEKESFINAVNSIPVDDSPKFKAGDEVWWLHIDEIGCGKLMEIRENRFSKEVDIVSTSRFVNLEYKFMFKTEEEAKQALRDKEK